MADTTSQTVKIAGEGITLSLLVWRRFKAPMPGVVEQILERQPELADRLFLEPGDSVEIPVALPRARSTTIDVIKLWD